MLERIQKANDIKDLKPEELPELAQEIRKRKGERTAKVVLAADYSVRFVPRIADNNTYNPWESYQ